MFADAALMLLRSNPGGSPSRITLLPESQNPKSLLLFATINKQHHS
jgi:hypothetical protein